ncbi:glucokinase [Actinomadura madurae]|uniref:Glucokinase n=1 Tax=Actinomadura madurae TaxID=1993 RepID=A0A1I4ZKL0_9ACTN|nr:glucokinase [Actinomadura madurae]SFN50816.1 glucokinase [Actinomadura madurae]
MSQWLVADVGGTNARFALVDGPEGLPAHVESLPTRDYPGLAEAAADYLARHAPSAKPSAACLAVAGPVGNGTFRLTNAGWPEGTPEAVRAHLGLPYLDIINDFEALALALPRLGPDDLIPVGGAQPKAGAPISGARISGARIPGAPLAGAPRAVASIPSAPISGAPVPSAPVPSAPISGVPIPVAPLAGAPTPGAPLAVVGPGTGLGVAGLVPTPSGWVPVPGEGGQVDIPAATEREIAVARLLRAEKGAVTAEYLLSGAGLVRVHRYLATLDGEPQEELTPRQICERQDDPRCRETLEMFCALLGSLAGNAALTLGARGGVYLGGGILPRIVDVLRGSAFRARFEGKPPVEDYMRAIPTALIVHPGPALVGATVRLAQSLPDLEPA